MLQTRAHPFQKTLIAVLISTGSILASGPQADSQTGLTYKNQVKFDVQIASTITAPARRPPTCQLLRVWHALPTPRKLGRLTATPDAIKYEPQSLGLVELEQDKLSSHVLFSQRSGIKPGKALQFVTRFSIVSSDRRLRDDYASRIRWQDIARSSDKSQSNLPGDMVKLVDQLKAHNGPVGTLQELCAWIKSSIKYDATVNWGNEDIRSTVRYRKGHCGHMAALFENMCKRIGIPVKRVWGLCMIDPAGKSFRNIHTWEKVKLPSVGWVELDPYGGKYCFFIPARMIECNTSFQAFSVWVTDRGKKSRMLPHAGQDSNNGTRYSVSHDVTFRQR